MIPADPPLHELKLTTRFSDRADDYVRYRPDYPGAAIDHVLSGLGSASDLTAADVGAGTGISARMLADRRVRVIAIEPNAEMRAAASAHPGVIWRDGSAESTGLGDAAVDLVLCAQAFHWFRPREAIEEFHRVLRPAGRLALMWNKRDRDDPLMRGYIESIRAVNGEDPSDRMEFEPAVVHAAGRFTPAERHSVPHTQRLDLEGFVGRARSASYVPKQGEGYRELVKRLGALHEVFRDADGYVLMRYRTDVWRARRLD